MLKLELTEQLSKNAGERPRRKVKIIGLGNAVFWVFMGFVTGYLLAALVAAPVWNR